MTLKVEAKSETAQNVSPAEKRAVVILSPHEAMGDAMMNVPFYRALRKALPNHRIIGVYLKDTMFRTVLSRVGRTFFDEIRTNQAFHRSPAQTREVLGAIPNPIDAVLDIQLNSRTLWTWIGSAPIARHYISPVPMYCFRRGIGFRPLLRPRDVASRRYGLVELLVGRRMPYDNSVPVVPEAAAIAARLLPRGPTYVAMAPGLTTTHKFWPLERHKEFGRRLVAMGATPVYLLGPFEDELRPWVAENIPEAKLIALDEAGGDPAFLPWVMHAAAKRFAATVATESGIGHLLASENIPLLTIANHLNPLRWRPTTPLWWLLRAQDYGSSDMAAIPVDAVMQALDEMLAWRALSAPG